MQLTIRTEFPEVAERLASLQRELAARVAARALNRTVDQARTQMSREIRQEFNLSAAKVREKLQVRRASFKAGMLGLTAELLSRTASGRRSLNLANFDARQTASGVTVKVKKRGGRKLVRGAFIGNRGRTVFERVPGTRMASRARYRGAHAQKIRPVQTIDVPQMFNARRINAAVVAAIRSRFPAIFQRELAFALTQFGRPR